MGRGLTIIGLLAAGYSAGLLLALVTAPDPAPVEPLAEPTPVVDAPADDESTVARGPTRDDEAAAIWAELEAMRAEVARTPVPPLAGSIDGRVLTEERRPLAGVAVKLSAYPREPRSWGPGTPALAEQTRRVMEHDLWGGARRQQTVTDAEGRFRFGRLAADARYSVRPELAPYDFEPWVSDAEPGQAITILAFWGAKPLIDVRMPDGSPAPAAHIESRDGRVRHSSDWQPGRPLAWALRLGTHYIRATHESYRSAEVIVEVVDGETVGTITLELQLRPSLRVQVRLPPGDQTFDIHGRYMRLRPGQTGSREQLLAATEFGLYRGGDPATLDELSPGRYLVGVGRRGRHIDLMREIEVKNQRVEVVFEYPPISEEETIVAWVWEGDQPFEGDCRFELTYQGERNKMRWRPGTVRLGPGQFALILDEGVQEGLAQPGYEFAVTANAANLGVQAIPITVPPPREVTFRYSLAATCAITVIGDSGKVNVWLGRLAADGQWTRAGNIQRAITPPAELQFGHHESGEYELRVIRGEREFLIHSERMVLAPGTNALTVTLPPLRRVTVTTDEHIERLWCTLRRPDDEDQQALPDRQGPRFFEFRVPDGEYVLVHSSRVTSGKRSIDVRGDVEIPLDPLIPDALLVELLAATGVLEHSGFLVGDLIVALDGESFRGARECRRAIARLSHATDVVVTVLRGDERLELTTVRPEGVSAGTVGGTLSPRRNE